MDYGVGGDNNGEWGKQLTVLVTTTRAADRRPIDPPPVVQLRVIDKSVSRSSSPDEQCVSFFRYSSLSLSLSGWIADWFLDFIFVFLYTKFSLILCKNQKSNQHIIGCDAALYFAPDPLDRPGLCSINLAK